MEFGDSLEALIPSYLVGVNRNSLKEGLKQFTPENRGKEINYENFFKIYNHNYFMQSDLVKEIRFAHWNSENTQYEKEYLDAIIVSNTCDISYSNNRDVNIKQCLLAPIIDLNEYLIDLQEKGYNEDKIRSFKQNAKAQLLSNAFYIPQHIDNGKEYLALFDRIFWFPTDELNSLIPSITEDKIASLNFFGFYLFIFKLSYHLCRLPEECDREVA